MKTIEVRHSLFLDLLTYARPEHKQQYSELLFWLERRPGIPELKPESPSSGGELDNLRKGAIARHRTLAQDTVRRDVPFSVLAERNAELLDALDKVDEVLAPTKKVRPQRSKGTYQVVTVRWRKAYSKDCLRCTKSGLSQSSHG